MINHLRSPNKAGEEIKKWVDDNSVPLVWEFSQSTAQKIFKGTAKVHYIYFEEKKENFAIGNVELSFT